MLVKIHQPRGKYYELPYAYVCSGLHYWITSDHGYREIPFKVGGQYAGFWV